MAAKIHPAAVVHPSAKLGEGVEIAAFAFIGENVELGEGTYIGPHSIVEHAVLGKANRVIGQAAIGTPPQDFSYKGEPTRVFMGDRNIVRESVTINRGTKASGKTVIGSDCMFMAYAHVAHDCVIGSHVIMANSATLAGHCQVGDRAFLSGLVALHQFVRVGTCAILSGGGMLNLDLTPYCVGQGDRAVLRGLNLVGMRRAGLSREAISAVKAAYKTLFLSSLPLKEALAQVRSSQLPEVLHMADFIEGSKRGVARPASLAAAEKEEAVF